MTEEILKKLAAVNSVEELKAVLAENDIQLEEGVTPEAFFETMKNGSDELNEDDLSDVSGGAIGIKSPSVSWAARKLGISIAVYIAKYLTRR